MADFQASSGPVDIVTSGTIIAFRHNSIEISFSPLPVVTPAPSLVTVPTGGSYSFPFPPLPPFKLIFRFIDETPQPGAPPPSARLESKPAGPLALDITLFNLTSPFGTGSVEPLNFGFSENRKLYLQYRVYALMGGDKTLQFTIYEDKEPNPELLRQQASTPVAEPKKETNGRFLDNRPDRPDGA